MSQLSDWRELGQKHVAQFGKPLGPSDQLRVLVAPAIAAAFSCLPVDLAATNTAGSRLRLKFFCVENNAPPEIFCNKGDAGYYVICNTNLIYHLYNVSRQIFCMRDVFTYIGNPGLERRIRTKYNRNSDFLKIKLNVYEAKSDVEYAPVGPNRNPRCQIRNHAYWLLFWYMVEVLILHELSHVVQGHLEFSKVHRAGKSLPSDTGTPEAFSLPIFSELTADMLAVEWFVAADLKSYGRYYSPMWRSVSPLHRRALRLSAPALAYWSFSSFDAEFCMDVRRHRMAITSYDDGHLNQETHLRKSSRVEDVQHLVMDRFSELARSKDFEALAKLAATGSKECAKALTFFSERSIFSSLYKGSIAEEVIARINTVGQWFEELDSYRFLTTRHMEALQHLLVRWVERNECQLTVGDDQSIRHFGALIRGRGIRRS